MKHLAPTLQTRHYQAGLTLVELMVALALSLLITLAAAGALLLSRQGFGSVDATSQLRDNARFAQDTLQRIGVQAGFRSLRDAAAPPPSDASLPPNVFGINNASRTSSSGPTEGAARSSTSVGYGSDILVFRYQTNSASAGDSSSMLPDGTMIDCMGLTSNESPSMADRMISIFHVGISNGEPSLMCSRSDTGAAPFDTQPLIQGVENFQVLYGVDGIGPGNTVVPIPSSTEDSVPERYLRADQLTIPGNPTATNANWQRVRSIRIGMVLRAGPGSAIDRTSQTFYPLGTTPASGTGAVGSAFASTSDPGTTFTPTPDGRLRQVVTFTIHLRNYQGDL